MPLEKQELENLMRLVRLTEDGEIDCERCLQIVAGFAEHELSGKSIPESLSAVQQHLNVCGECREEYEALLAALRSNETS